MKRRIGFSLCAASLALVACQPKFDHLEVRKLSGSGEATSSRVEVLEAHALVIEVRPVSRNRFEDYEDFNIVELESANETIVLAAPADDVQRWVIVGSGLGSTELDVVVDGKVEDAMIAEVDPQGVAQ